MNSENIVLCDWDEAFQEIIPQRRNQKYNENSRNFVAVFGGHFSL